MRGQRHAPAALHPLPRKETWCPLYRRLGGPQSRSGRVQKISPTPGFDPRTVQPVASRYTDYAIPTLLLLLLLLLLLYDMDVSCHRPFLPGASLEPAVIPTAQASGFTLQYFPYYV